MHNISHLEGGVDAFGFHSGKADMWFYGASESFFLLALSVDKDYASTSLFQEQIF